MELRPTETAAWAETSFTEPVSVRGQAFLVANKVEPSSELKNTGIRGRSPVYRDNLNWVLNNLYRWARNHDGRTSQVGSIQIFSAARNVSDLADQFGGTWADRGTQAMGSITAYVYERVS